MKMNRTITKVSLLALASIVSFIVIGKYVITTEGLQDETGFYIDAIASVTFVITLVILVWQARLEMDTVVREAYATLRSDHQNLIHLPIENEKLLKIFQRTKNVDGKEIELTSDENIIVQHYVAEFDLYERVWDDMKDNDVLSDLEWQQWLVWIEDMSHHELFRYTFDKYRYMFDDAFMEDIGQNIIEKKPSCLFCKKTFKDMRDVIKHTKGEHPEEFEKRGK